MSRKTLELREHEHVVRGQSSDGKKWLSVEEFERLRAFDDRRAGPDGDLIFEWRSRYMKAQNWVGVVEVGDTSVEILPKVDTLDDTGAVGSVRRNFLYMLAVATDLPIRAEDLAGQRVEERPILETLVTIFARRLKEELLNGPYRSYVRRRENLRKLKGKLLVTEHIKRNAAHGERFFVAHDEFEADNWFNRVLRAACRYLLDICQTRAAAEPLRQCLMLLDHVADVEIREHHFERVRLDRRNERFHTLYEFAKLVLARRSPMASIGGHHTFALVFNMQALFESFITEFLRRRVLTRDILGAAAPHCRLYAQRGRKLRHLIYHDRDGERGRGALQLQPDIVIIYERGGGTRRLVIDTKWKRLAPRKTRRGVKREDIHQMYAYAHTYDADHNILLYPKPGEVETPSYVMPVGDTGIERFLHVRFVDLSRDLAERSDELACKLGDMISKYLEIEDVTHRASASRAVAGATPG